MTGHVSTYAEKMAAEKAALRVKGVRGIAQEIEVRYPDDKKTTDDEIAVRAINVLRWSAVVPADSVLVKVQEGWVTLDGRVNWNHERSAAEAEMRRLSGVAGVLNNITIDSEAQAADVKRKIEDALKQNAGIQSQKVSVAVKDGTVSLDGCVHDCQERDIIERAARSVPGIKGVEDNLRTS